MLRALTEKYRSLVTIRILIAMDNKTVARFLQQTGIMTELTGGNPFSARAHFSAARIIDNFVDENGFPEIRRYKLDPSIYG